MTHLLGAALRRRLENWTARKKSAALTRQLDAHALTELGFPKAQSKSDLRDWFLPKL